MEFLKFQKSNICMQAEKLLHFMLKCPLSPREGGGVIKTLAELSSKNVSLF